MFIILLFISERLFLWNYGKFTQTRGIHWLICLTKPLTATSLEVIEHLIQDVRFTTPNQIETDFEIKVNDSTLLSFVEEGIGWDSYFFW